MADLQSLLALDPRELDARVHQVIMGYEGIPGNGPPWYSDPRSSSLMLTVLDRLLQLGFEPWMEAFVREGKPVWFVGFTIAATGHDTGSIEDASLPRAVAIAALVAMEGRSDG